MYIISEIMLELSQEGFFEDCPTVLLLDLPSEKDLPVGLNSLRNNEIFVFAISGYSNVNHGTSFDVAFPFHAIEEACFSTSILENSFINPSYTLDYLPKGYTGICKFYFTHEKPTILDKLAGYQSQKKHGINDSILLTQQSFFNVLIQRLKDSS